MQYSSVSLWNAKPWWFLINFIMFGISVNIYTFWEGSAGFVMLCTMHRFHYFSLRLKFKISQIKCQTPDTKTFLLTSDDSSFNKLLWHLCAEIKINYLFPFTNQSWGLFDLESYSYLFFMSSSSKQSIVFLYFTARQFFHYDWNETIIYSRDTWKVIKPSLLC